MTLLRYLILCIIYIYIYIFLINVNILQEISLEEDPSGWFWRTLDASTLADGLPAEGLPADGPIADGSPVDGTADTTGGRSRRQRLEEEFVSIQVSK